MSLLLKTFVAAAAIAPLFSQVAAVTGSTYVLQQEYSGANFFDGFDFWAWDDPTNGNVTYVDWEDATALGLIVATDGAPAYMGVDYWTENAVEGRKSVRISSKMNITHGLIISDIAHMPGGICGTWPAHWTLGPDWPSGGEIDFIEGDNSQSQNLMSLHTSSGCTITGSEQTGTFQTNDCDATGTGCGSINEDSRSFGSGFNDISSGSSGGSVYAMQWTSDYIRVWFFPAGSVPADISTANPNPANWGTPTANFQGDCSIDDHFYSHSIIFDTTFCGDYAGVNWAYDDTCSKLAPTCEEYVQNNPAVFKDAYWSINSVKYYDLEPEVFTSTLTSTTSTSLTSAIPQSSVYAPGMGLSRSATTTSTSSTATLAYDSQETGSSAKGYTNKTSTYVPVSKATSTSQTPIGAFLFIVGVLSLSFHGALSLISSA